MPSGTGGLNLGISFPLPGTRGVLDAYLGVVISDRRNIAKKGIKKLRFTSLSSFIIWLSNLFRNLLIYLILKIITHPLNIRIDYFAVVD